MPSKNQTPRLDRAQVVDTALRLLDEVGLDRLSLRLIAGELEVKAPALYWHFRDKRELLDEMATEMYRRMTAAGDEPPGFAADDWRGRLTATAHGLRAGLLSWRDGARVFSGTRFTGDEHGRGMEAQLANLTAAGFTFPQAVTLATALFTYVLGFVTEEQGMIAYADDPRPALDMAERERRLAATPLAAEAGPLVFGDYDTRFTEGIALLVAGAGARYGVG
ncbi:TetR/AcrR family transcriptional regulator C-terminal domain-containing protein [Streptomyces sp. NPDC088923]|uniref:TetR/AcrR family transcriptional regulator C-terminal domain-containing protein n=1 Tax=Streptomyces sp. NPDC088923 TaxID=3365913 RepID=UPI0038224B8F